MLLIRRELQEIVVLTSKLTTQLGIILTSKNDHFINSIGIIALARKYPNQQVIGYELSWFPWLVSMMLKRGLGLDNLIIYRRNFQKADLSNAAVLLCYLFPQGMIELDKKLKRELSNNVLIVSNTFSFPSYQPIEIIKLNDLYQTPIYLYCWQAIPVIVQNTKFSKQY